MNRAPAAPVAQTESPPAAVDRPCLRVAYLTNVYPKVSHTFIRRELRAIEARGVEVIRLSVRPAREELVDPADREENAKTESILGRGALSLAGALLITLLTRPLGWLRGLTLALRLGPRSDRGVLRHLVYFVEACALRRRLRSRKVDHLHVHFGTNATSVALLAHAVEPFSFSFANHGSEEFDKPEALHTRRKVAAAAFVTTISAFGRSQTCRWSNLEDWPKIHIVRCGVGDRCLNHEVVPVPSPRRVVNVGRLSVEKGQNLLLEAVARLRGEGCDVQVVFVGDGPMRRELQDTARRLGLDGQVEFRGSLSEEGVIEELLRARGMVLPSLMEGLPVTLMESLALARPVVASRVAGIPELVEEGRSGWLVTPGDLDELCRGIRALVEADPSRLDEMGRHGRERVRSHHDSRREAARLLELFQAVRIGAADPARQRSRG